MSFWDDGQENDEDKGTINKQNPFANQKQPKYKFDSESSDEDNKRVVKTPKEKLLELMKKSCNKIRDNISSKNFIVANEVFDELVKSFDKIKQFFSDNPPILFIKTLSLLEEASNMSKEDRGKISTKNNTSLTGIKKTYTKYIKNFEECLKAYKEKKAAGGEAEDEDE
jgi:translation initiation factor 3 subunit C